MSNKKLKMAIMLCIVFGMFTALTVVTHAVTATQAAVAITVTEDDGSTAITNFSSGSIAVQNSAGETLDQGIDYSLSISSNLYTVSALAYADTYSVSFSSGSTTVTVDVAAAIALTAKTGKLKWSSSVNYHAAKSGVIAGNAVDASGNPLSGVTVKAVVGSLTYQSTSASTTGAYKIYVPAGAYTLIVVGKDTGTNYKNVSSTIKVTAGQASGPMTNSDANQTFDTNAEMIGLTGLTITGSSKTVAGSAAKNSTVSVYVYEPTNPVVYQYAGNKKITALTGATIGSINILLKAYPAGKKYAVFVKDTAKNVYESTTYESSAASNMTATLTADSTLATVVNPIDLTITEPTGVVGNLYKNVTSITCTSSSQTFTLTASSYSALATKITIKAGTLSTAQTYCITVKATGYNDMSVTQAIAASATAAPTSIAGTFTVAAGGGTVAGSAKFSAIGTAGTGNVLVYKVTSSTASGIYLGNTLTGYTVLAASTDITGVSTTNKYIDVVEITTPGAKIVKAKRFTITAAQIKVPSILSKVVNGTSLLLIADGSLDTDAAAASSFTVKSGAAGATSNSVSNVAITGRTVTLTLGTTVTSTESVNIKYVVPASNPLQDTGGNKVVAIAASANNVLVCTGGATCSAASVNSSGSGITVTMSAAMTSAGTLKDAFRVYVNGTPATVSSASVSTTTVTISITGTTIVSGNTVEFDFVPTSSNYMKDASDIKAPGFSGVATNGL